MPPLQPATPGTHSLIPSIGSLSWPPLYWWRIFACVNAFALLVLPKTMFGLTRYRPEDFTGAFLLAVFLVVAVRKGVRWPNGRLGLIIVTYFAYFLAILTLRD